MNPYETALASKRKAIQELEAQQKMHFKIIKRILGYPKSTRAKILTKRYWHIFEHLMAARLIQVQKNIIRAQPLEPRFATGGIVVGINSGNTRPGEQVLNRDQQRIIGNAVTILKSKQNDDSQRPQKRG